MLIWLFAEALMYCEGVCWCLHVKYTVYKHFNTSVHAGPSNPRRL